MHRTFAACSWLLGLAAILGLAPGCGQNEGGRCQVTSDCASGLICFQGETGNGVCRAPGTGFTTDASMGQDAAADLALVSGPETQTPGPDAELDTADTAPAAIDAEPAIDVEPAADGEAIDALAID